MVTDEEVRGYGWNAIQHDNLTGNLMVLSQQLSLIGQLLVEIRDLLVPAAGEEESDAD